MPCLKNIRQELFCLAIFKGLSQKDAAIKAGYSSKWARSIASRLSTNANITARILELHEEIKSDAIMEPKERRERLSQLAREEIKQPVTAREVVMAIGEHNKMDHIYTEPDKEDKVIVQTSIFILPDGRRLTAEQLKDAKAIEVSDATQ